MPHISGLYDSKFAPTIAKPVDDIATSAQELLRFQTAVRRLKWKLPYLADSHRKVTTTEGLPVHEQKEIETMFKLDFYEFYTVLERALVHLLGVFGYSVEAGRNDL